MAERIAENSGTMSDLEDMIDKHGVRNVIDALSHIALEKASHVQSTWQDRAMARSWEKVSDALRLFALNRLPPSPLD